MEIPYTVHLVFLAIILFLVTGKPLFMFAIFIALGWLFVHAFLKFFDQSE